MKAPALAGWRPIVTAFAVWFLHFMMCWAAGEIWPQQWPANALAWAATAVALLALGLHFARVRARHSQGTLPAWHYRFSQGAVALAAVAVIFSAVPSVVFLP